MPQNVTFFNPENEAKYRRQQMLAQSLMKYGEPRKTEVVSGIAVPQSNLQPLADALSYGVGFSLADDSNKLAAEDAKARQQFLQSAVSQYGNDPKMLAQALMTQPSTADTGLSLYGDAIKGDQMSAYQAAMLGLQNRKFENEVVQQTQNPKISVRDEMRMAKSEEGAQGAQRVEQLAGEAKNILGRYETNRAAPIIGGASRILAATPFASEETKRAATDYENLDKISKELGVQTLAQFGGNDTDKELQVAIQTNIDPSATVETNMATINRKLAAAQILQQKPDFEAQWVAKNGGLNRLDRETGRSFQSEWLGIQRNMWKSAMSPQSTKANQLTQTQPVQLSAPLPEGITEEDVAEYKKRLEGR